MSEPVNIRVGRARRDRGILVARPSALGNPFPISESMTREAAIAAYREWLDESIRGGDRRVRNAIARIVREARRGPVTLLCFCAPQACHGDVIAERVRAIIRARRGMVTARVRGFEEWPGIDQYEHAIVDENGNVIETDWIMDDGTDYWTGKDITEDVNAMYRRHALRSPFKKLR